MEAEPEVEDTCSGSWGPVVIPAETDSCDEVADGGAADDGAVIFIS